MAPDPSRRAPLAVLGVLAALLALLVPGCGDDDGGAGQGGGSEQAAQKTNFPAADGKTLAELRDGLSPGPVLAPTVSVLNPGENRFGFALYDRARKQISAAPAAIYVARVGGGPAAGPFYANDESLEVKPPFQSQTVKNDPDGADSMYVAQVDFAREGTYEVLGVVKFDGRLVATDPAGAKVSRDDPVPGVGDRAPRIDTPTVASAGGDVRSIDTRDPPGTMHEESFADVVGKKPVVLVFATPALCRSRVCGPVVDIAEQVKASYKGDAAFIHMEIFNDNEIEKGERPQVKAYRLPSEPWAFTVSRDGKVAARLEGSYSERELDDAIKAAEAR